MPPARRCSPPYSIQNFTGARVAFIGMTLEGTPTIVSAAGIAGYSFRDEADTVNALVPELRRRGVESIVVLVHEGGAQTVAADPATINTCAGISGPIVDIVNRLDDAVDLVVSGHTHQAYNCQIDGKAVTSAYSFGRVVTDIDMKVDRRTGDATSISVNNRVDHPRRRQGPADHLADRPVLDDRRPDRQPAHRPDHRRHHPRQRRLT